MYRDKNKKSFSGHKKRAKIRGICFSLTYDEWLTIWKTSGHLHQRGIYKGCYVMGRNGDKGPYAVGNVSIISVSENNSYARIHGTPWNKGKTGLQKRPDLTRLNKARIWTKKARAALSNFAKNRTDLRRNRKGQYRVTPR